MFIPLKRDPVKGLILERQVAYKKTDQELASVIGVSRQTFSRMIRDMHTEEWELGQIRRILYSLNVTPQQFAKALASVNSIYTEE